MNGKKIVCIIGLAVLVWGCGKTEAPIEHVINQPAAPAVLNNTPSEPDKPAETESAAQGEPDGKLIDGIRIIEIAPDKDPHSLYVYRGDTLKLNFAAKSYPFSVHIPELKASAESADGAAVSLDVKVKKVGTYDIFCNGDCPAGDGAKHGMIVVMQYEGTTETFYKELTAAETKAVLDKGVDLLLDVRTPREYYDGHIEGAVLIPVQQLSSRISEIEDYKDKQVLLYCRSGNRSTVAAEIMRQNGFKQLYNLRSGIRGWLMEDYPLVTR